MRGTFGWVLLVVGIATSARAADEAPWAFRPVARPSVPDGGPSHPIDAFLGKARADAGMNAAPEADRRTLVRRLTFDLTGLPPTPEEVAAFAADDRPDAYERLVDRLLASPRYGERQARQWLDLVRYAETHGYERDDPKPDAWRYRDWVVNAFNRDQPYNAFVVDQLAGDERPGADVASKTATGFYRLGLIDDEPADPVMDRFDQLDDTVRTVGTAFLGLTIHCARCHDHKFDPISQADYYRLVAFFAPGERYRRGDDDSLTVDLADEGQVRRVEGLEAAVERRLRELRTRRSKAGEGALKAQLEREIRELERNRPVPLPTVLGLTDAGPTAEPTKLLVRGDAHRPGEVVAPGFLRVIDDRPPAIEPPPDGKTTGLRLALARWIAAPENPLTARVMVNRLWQGHFGRGLVGTPSDFGAMGEEPELPGLLDWLAAEFVARGWSVKAMHRLIVTSAAYRQAGDWDESAATDDSANALHWRMPPRRLEAEAIRDAALAVAGVLNPAVGGPSVRPPIDGAVLAGQSVPGRGWAVSKGDAVYRRSIYVHVKRTLPLPELEVLDAPSPDEPCPRRGVTTTAPQALTFLNGAFWHETAGHLADRLRREAGPDPAAQVRRAFALAFQRGATDAEVARALEFLRTQARQVAERPDAAHRADPGAQALRAFGLVILNANEFVTVD
jgi:hypothetical protein